MNDDQLDPIMAEDEVESEEGLDEEGMPKKPVADDEEEEEEEQSE